MSIVLAIVIIIYSNIVFIFYFNVFFGMGECLPTLVWENVFQTDKIMCLIERKKSGKKRNVMGFNPTK